MKFGTALSAAQWGRLVVVGALATGVLSTTAGRGTLAYFTTQVKSTANSFTAGNLHFTIADNDEVATAPSVTSSMTLTNLKPGDVVYAPLTLANTGSVDAKWGIKYTTTTGAANLATALKLGVVGRGTGTGATGDCNGTGSGWADATGWKELILATPEAM